MNSGFCIPTIILIVIGVLQLLAGIASIHIASDSMSIEMYKRLMVINVLASIVYIALAYYFCHIGNTLASWMFIIIPILYSIYMYFLVQYVVKPNIGDLTNKLIKHVQEKHIQKEGYNHGDIGLGVNPRPPKTFHELDHKKGGKTITDVNLGDYPTQSENFSVWSDHHDSTASMQTHDYSVDTSGVE